MNDPTKQDVIDSPSLRHDLIREWLPGDRKVSLEDAILSAMIMRHLPDDIHVVRDPSDGSWQMIDCHNAPIHEQCAQVSDRYTVAAADTFVEATILGAAVLQLECISAREVQS